MLILFWGTHNRENIIDMDGGHHNTMRVLAIIDAPFTGKMSEAPKNHGLMHLFVPDAATLLHAVESLV